MNDLVEEYVQAMKSISWCWGQVYQENIPSPSTRIRQPTVFNRKVKTPSSGFWNSARAKAYITPTTCKWKPRSYLKYSTRWNSHYSENRPALQYCWTIETPSNSMKKRWWSISGKFQQSMIMTKTQKKMLASSLRHFELETADAQSVVRTGRPGELPVGKTGIRGHSKRTGIAPRRH